MGRDLQQRRHDLRWERPGQHGGGGDRPGGNEGATAKLPIEFAGYVNTGTARTPIVKFSDAAIERAKNKAEGWKALCAKYKPLVDTARTQAKVA